MSSYYYQNREDLLKKAHDKYRKEYGKERAEKYYQANKEEIFKREGLKYRFMPEGDKNVIRENEV